MTDKARIDFREKIINYRAEHNLSQEKFAEKCKVSRQTITLIENLSRKPTALTLYKILKVIE